MKISIHQCYFAPYPGWMRLLTNVDLHVVYDDVQFPRRGWVHRNRLYDRNGKLQWLTLPLRKPDFSDRICDLKFAEDAEERMAEECRRFPAIDRLPSDVRQSLLAVKRFGSFVPYAQDLLLSCAIEMGLECRWMLASDLEIPPEVKGQDRIIEICKRLGAKRYLNSPGGVELYNAATFARHGIELEFLEPWTGSMASVLETLATEGRMAA